MSKTQKVIKSVPVQSLDMKSSLGVDLSLRVCLISSQLEFDIKHSSI